MTSPSFHRDYTKAIMTPCLPYLYERGHLWYLSSDCPEIARLASLSKEDLRVLYEDFCAAAEPKTGRSLTQSDAGYLHLLFEAARELARDLGKPETERVFYQIATWCLDRSLGQIGDHIPQSQGSLGGDWFEESGR